MRVTNHTCSLIAVFGAAFLAAGCTEEQSTPLTPSLSVAGTGCDLRAALGARRTYFQDTDLRAQAEYVVFDMMDDCALGDDDAYTSGFFQAAGLVQQAIAGGTDGPAADGATYLGALLTATTPGGAEAFDPCDGAAGCTSWDGYPTPPNFTEALTRPSGGFAVITTGTDAVCSGHRVPCANIDPDIGADGDTWGVEPSSTWEGALHGRTTVLFGFPIPGPSPTGEALLSTPMPAYEWNLIPHPDMFAPNATPAASLEVGLCSTALAGLDEALVQKNSTVLQQATLSFCPSQTAAAPAPSGLAAIGHFVRNLIDPRPRQLVATAFRAGPGGSAGSFSKFYATDLPREATWEFFSFPKDVAVGQTLDDGTGQIPIIRAITTSVASPLERATATVTLRKNNGLAASGNAVSPDPNANTSFTCSGAVCTGLTQADQQTVPGAIELPLQVSKPGAYRLCVTGTLPPLDFVEEVCSPKFNVRPGQQGN